MPRVDVVVVSYNSREHLRRCVEPLASEPGLRVTVVDNASTDRSLDVLADLETADRVQLEQNRGFAAGCNVGCRAGTAPVVLFLNPDATIEPDAVRRLASELERYEDCGAIAPRIEGLDGSLHYSLRRFPRLRSRYAQALFLHRLFPRWSLTDELIRDERFYDLAGPREWVSGACIMVKRAVLERLGGFDEGFFMYSEDTDLCRRVWDLGLEVRYEPGIRAVHVGGASAPRTELLSVLAASRLRYAQKHWSRPAAALERLGIVLGALTHVLVTRGGRPARAGHARSLRLLIARPLWSRRRDSARQGVR